MDRVGETQAIFRWAGGDLKKRRLLGAPVSAGRIEPKVAISLRGCDSTAWRPLQKSVLHKEWLIDFFERPYIFSNRRGNSADADRPAVELLYDGLEDPRVHVVEPELIDLEQLQRIGGVSMPSRVVAPMRVNFSIGMVIVCALGPSERRISIL